MVRTQVQFEEKQYETIRRLAHRHRLSVAAAIRQLVDRGLREGLEPAPHKDRSALLKLAGIGASGVKNLGRQHDDYLADEIDGKARPRGGTSATAAPSRRTAAKGKGTSTAKSAPAHRAAAKDKKTSGGGAK